MPPTDPEIALLGEVIRTFAILDYESRERVVRYAASLSADLLDKALAPYDTRDQKIARPAPSVTAFVPPETKRNFRGQFYWRGKWRTA